MGAPTLHDIWVDPVQGDDANSGATRALAVRTVANAWERIPSRTLLAETGYRILLVAGNYSESDVPLYWEGRWGTFENPVIIQAADAPGSAILPALRIYGSSFIYLIGIDVRAAGAGAVILENCDHVLIRDMRLEGGGGLPRELFQAYQSRFVYVEDSSALHCEAGGSVAGTLPQCGLYALADSALGGADTVTPSSSSGELPLVQVPSSQRQYAAISPAADGGGLSVAPRILFFAQALGQAAPPPASLSITPASTFQASIIDAPWLSVESTTSTIQVSANSSALDPGLYSGAVSIAPAVGSTIRVPVTLQVFNPAALPASFTDVPASHPFADYIFLLKSFSVTLGCTTTTYCPDKAVTRGQMAAFLIRARFGESFSFSPVQSFTDVPPAHPFFNYIQKLRETGITLGCTETAFCPDDSVTRGQMAAFLIRALLGESFTYSTAAAFDDVPDSQPFFKYVQKLKELGITRGCTATQYCPGNPVTRGEMAAFLGRAFFGYGLPTATPPPNAAQCTVFPSDHIWNTPVDTLAVHPQSSAWVTTIGAARGFHADFGSGLWEGAPIGIPFVQVTSSPAPVAVSFEYSDESDAGPYPIPPNPPIEGGPQSGGDRHVLVLDQAACKLYELYAAYPNQDGSWRAGSGAIYDLRGYALRPAGWTSADAAGLPILPGLVRYEEVAAGEIRHAIRFTVPQSQRSYLWPARHYASSLTGSQYPPMGARFRLKADYDISTYPASVQVILRAMKKYGIINADNGSAWFISGAPNEQWDNDELAQFSRLRGADFEAVDTAPLMIDSNSGRARQP
jgi:hypothetical protein